MWSLDLSPATVEICYRGIQAAVPTAHRGERGASRRRGRASPVMQPVAGMRRTRRDGRSFPERQSLFLQHPNDPTRLYHGQPEHSERTNTYSRLLSSHKNHQKSSEAMIVFWPGCQAWGIVCAKKKYIKFHVEQHINPWFPRFSSSQSWDRSGERRGGGGGGWWLEAEDEKNRHNQRARRRERGREGEMFRAQQQHFTQKQAHCKKCPFQQVCSSNAESQGFIFRNKKRTHGFLVETLHVFRQQYTEGKQLATLFLYILQKQRQIQSSLEQYLKKINKRWIKWDYI